MQKIVLAPDSFKGSLSAIEVCQILAEVGQKHFPETEMVQLPIADGGEGLVDALLLACGGEKIWAEVADPLGRPIQAFYGILGDGTAVIEMAAASGLPLLKDSEKDILKTSTYGTGQLIGDALKRGCRAFILGLGGSATNDGGAGAAAALGIRYLDREGNEIRSGGALNQLEQIDTSQLQAGLELARFKIACDVNNPLFGPNGAAHIYAPQKGAKPQHVELLDQGLQRLASVMLVQTGLDMQDVPGSGAAGGLAVPFLAFLQAELVPGLALVLEKVGFDDHLKGSDLVITGEGSTDAQSSMGKVLYGIGKRAAAAGVPVIAISGALQPGYEKLYDHGITAMFAATRRVCRLEEAMKEAETNLRATAEDVFRMLKYLTS